MKKGHFILLVFILTLVWTNPRKEVFFDTLGQHYGKIHKGIHLSTKDLKKIGQYEYTSYWMFSSFNYQFGTIQVSYIGLGTFVFQTGTSVAPVKEDKRQFTYISLLAEDLGPDYL